MSNFAVVLRAVVSFGWLALIAGGGWIGWRMFHSHDLELKERDDRLAQQEAELDRQTRAVTELEATVAERDETVAQQQDQIGELEEDVVEKQAEIDHLDLSLRLLKVEKRVAQVVVSRQEGSEEDGDLATLVKFVEVDGEGDALGSVKTLEIDGDVLYVDSWVVKFDDELVEGADSLRKSSMVLFRRMFGENQEPSEGIALDNPDQRPEVYGGDQPMSEFERGIWENFWEYANEPEKAQEVGIRAAHGEAVSMKLRPGRVYELTLRASGGLSFEPAKLPAVMGD